MENEKQLVVVLTRSYSTGLSVIRSLGSAGYTVDVIASEHKEGVMEVAARSKYVRSFTEVVSKKVKAGEDLDLVEALLKYEGQNERKPVLFPTDDYTASIMDANRRRLEEIFIMPGIVGGGDGSMTNAMDKMLQSELARQCGIPIPQEWVVPLQKRKKLKDGRRVVFTPRDLVFPCFCKPIESVTGYKHEMAVCRDRDELRAHLGKLRRTFKDRSVLVQEFLKIDHEIDLSGVALDQEVIIPGIVRKTRVAQYSRGVTLAGQVEPFEALGELCDKLVEMVRRLHYVGMFDLELNVVGDRIYFNEINLRSGGPNFVYYLSGVNLPALYVKEATGGRHRPEEERIESFGKTFVSEKTAWEDYVYGFMSKRALNDLLDRSDFHLLINEDDPAPGELFLEEMHAVEREQKLKKVPKKIRNFLRNGKAGLKNGLKQAKRGVKRFLRRTKSSLFVPLRAMKHKLLHYPQTDPKNRRDPNSPLPRVLVAGQSFTANLSVARSLGEAGYEVEVLRVFASTPKRGSLRERLKPEAYSRYVKAYYGFTVGKRSARLADKLIQLSDPDRKMLLIPTDENVELIVDKYYDLLHPYYLMPNVHDESGGITGIQKGIFQEGLASDMGLPVAESCYIRAERGEFTIPESVSYPCRMQVIGNRSGLVRSRKCRDARALQKALQRLSADSVIEVRVTNVPEVSGRYVLLGVSAGSDISCPALCKTATFGSGRHSERLLTGTLLSAETCRPLVAGVEELIREIHYEGLFSVHFVETAEGELLFHSLNLRPSPFLYALTAGGVNLPALYADSLLRGVPLDGRGLSATEGRSFVSEKALMDEYRAEALSLPEIRTQMDRADAHIVFSASDPEPYRHFEKFYGTVRRMLRRRSLKRAVRRFGRGVKHAVRGLLKGVYIRQQHYPQTKSGNRRDPSSAFPRVLVAGESYIANLSLARSLGAAGYEVEILRVFRRAPKRSSLQKRVKPDAYSRAVKFYDEFAADNSRIRLVRRLLRQADPARKMLLIPTDKFTAQAIERYEELLSPIFLTQRFTLPEEKRPDLSNAAVLEDLALQAGLPILRSWLITANAWRGKYRHRFMIPETLGYPCLVRGTEQNLRPRPCRDVRELRRVLSRLSEKQTVRVKVQSLPEGASRYSLLGLSTASGVVCPGLLSLGQASGDGEASGLTGSVLADWRYADIKAAAARLVKNLHYEGLFSVELLEAPGKGLVFSDLQLYASPYAQILTQCGVDLPALYADELLKGKAVDPSVRLARADRHFVNEKLLLDAYRRGELDRERVRALTNEAELHCVLSKSDPAPYRHFEPFYRTVELYRRRQTARLARHEAARRRNQRIGRFFASLSYILNGYPQSKRRNRRDPNAAKPRVLVSGRNYCSNLCLARSFGQAGYDVEVLRIFQTKPKLLSFSGLLRRRLRPEAYSKYVKGYYVCVTNRDKKRLLESLVSLADPHSKMLLIPADDLVADVVDENYARLSELYRIPNVQERTRGISDLMSKDVQKELATGAALPTVNSCKIVVTRDEKGQRRKIEIPESVTYPCFVKPNVSMESSKSQMRRCDTPDELVSALKSASRDKSKASVQMLVEDYLEISHEYSILGLSTKQGVVAPGFFIAEQGGHKERRGVAMTGRIIPFGERAGLIKQMADFVAGLGYEGLFDIDLIETADGTMYFTELNLRYGASGYAVTESGANLPGMFADYILLDKPIDPSCSLEKTGKLFISEKVMIDEYMHGFITRQELDHLMASVDVHFIFNEKDMRPYKHFKSFYPLCALIRANFLRKQK